MKAIVVSLLFVLICTIEVNAQDIQSETDRFLSGIDFLLEVKPNNNLLIQQININDNAFPAGEQKVDFSNKAIINQTGNYHYTQLKQTGSGNEAQLFSEGGFTNMNIIQKGNYNSIFSTLSNSTTQLYSSVVQQNGDGNNIELTLLGNNVIPNIVRIVSITQTGNNLNFSGTYDSPEVPVQVDQKSGIAGTGMTVRVATSAFYSPMK